METEWHHIVIAGRNLADYARRELKQDDQVYLEGDLQTVSWRSLTYDL